MLQASWDGRVEVGVVALGEWVDVGAEHPGALLDSSGEAVEGVHGEGRRLIGRESELLVGAERLGLPDPYGIAVGVTMLAGSAMVCSAVSWKGSGVALRHVGAGIRQGVPAGRVLIRLSTRAVHRR